MYAKISPPVFNQNLYVNNSTPQNTPAATLSANFSSKKTVDNKVRFKGLGARVMEFMRSGRITPDELDGLVSDAVRLMQDPRAKFIEIDRVGPLLTVNRKELSSGQIDRLKKGFKTSRLNAMKGVVSNIIYGK